MNVEWTPNEEWTPSGYVVYIPEFKKWFLFESRQAYLTFMKELVKKMEHDLLYGKDKI